MEYIIKVISSVGVGFIGILFYTFFKAAKYFKNKDHDFSFRKLRVENKLPFYWCMIMLILSAILFNWIPETADGISAVTGIDFLNNIAGFFTLGAGLRALMNKTNKP